jgi:hypothetical protein
VLDRALLRRDVFGRAPQITAIACSLKGKLMLGTILLIVLILLLLGALPTSSVRCPHGLTVEIGATTQAAELACCW